VILEASIFYYNIFTHQNGETNHSYVVYLRSWFYITTLNIFKRKATGVTTV